MKNKIFLKCRMQGETGSGMRTLRRSAGDVCFTYVLYAHVPRFGLYQSMTTQSTVQVSSEIRAAGQREEWDVRDALGTMSVALSVRVADC